MDSKRRLIALALAALFIAFAALSLTFMLIESDHDCDGADCPICEQIALLCSTLRMAVAVIVTLLLSVIAVNRAKILYEHFRAGYRADTLVLLKTKLSN